MLEAIPRSSHIVGLKQTSRAIKENQVRLVYLANDCDQNIKNQVHELCLEGGVECIEEHTMAELGKSCGIDVGASVVGLI